MSSTGERAEVTNDEAARRYEVHIGAEVAYLDYALNGGTIRLIHTEVPPALEGQGIGGALAKHALEDARARQLTVIPECSFVASYIRRHQEYLPLVAPDWRAYVTRG